MKNQPERVLIAKRFVDSVKEPGLYLDEKLPGFRLKVTETGKKVYLVYSKVAGKPGEPPVKVTIGRHGDKMPDGTDLTADKARTEAAKIKGLMLDGINPNEQRKLDDHAKAEQKKIEQAERKVKELTVGAAFDEFLKTKEQKESTIKVYRYVVEKHLASWLDKPLVDITQDDVLKRYNAIASESASSASHAMRIFRAVFLTAQVRHSEDIPQLARINPVKFLTHAKRGWNTVDPRHDFIPNEDLPAFYQAVCQLKSEVARDYLMVCILTGLRKNEVCTLKWGENVDMRKKTITITSEQAKNKQRHMLAMSDYLCGLFLRRWEARTNEYVFPGKSKDGNFSDPEKPIKEVIKQAQIEPFSSHSLRRTFATTADALGYGLHEVQRLLNHKPGTVTQKHYIQNLVERTKEPMQRINDRLLELMGAKSAQEQAPENKVVALTAASSR